MRPVHWIVSRRSDVHKFDPLLLALAPEGCIFRKRGLNALTRLGRDHKIICSSQHTSAIRAVVRSGLALSIFARDDGPCGSPMLGASDGLPLFPDVTIMLLISPRLRDLRHNLLARGLVEMLTRPI